MLCYTPYTDNDVNKTNIADVSQIVCKTNIADVPQIVCKTVSQIVCKTNIADVNQTNITDVSQIICKTNLEAIATMQPIRCEYKGPAGEFDALWVDTKTDIDSPTHAVLISMDTGRILLTGLTNIRVAESQCRELWIKAKAETTGAYYTGPGV